MSIQRSDDLTLQVDDGLGGTQTIGGLRNRAISFQSALNDVSDIASGIWRDLLPDNGLRQVSVRGNGLFADQAGASRVRAIFFSSTHSHWEIIIPSTGVLSGNFQITNLEFSGNQGAMANFSIVLASSGALSFIEEGA